MEAIYVNGSIVPEFLADGDKRHKMLLRSLLRPFLELKKDPPPLYVYPIRQSNNLSFLLDEECVCGDGRLAAEDKARAGKIG
jgi:hypothetical protein